MSASMLIRNIRVEHGFNDDDRLTSTPAVSGLRGKLERALERLSTDLYNTKTHFLLEFIQNADDNTYAADVIPSLNLRIEDSLIVFECNELGFSADNVKAICDIGGSTKATNNSTRGFIGEKGIGFKSVFTVANEVHISSGPYSFYFDRTAPLGMITPIWGSAYPPKPGWTTFHLRLASSENGTDISAQLSILRPTLLLFLRQLRSLNVTVTVKGAAQYNALKISREDEPKNDLVSLLKRMDGGELKVERYMLVRKFAQTPAQEPEREGIERSEIVLAFPVTETGDAVIRTQDVHAFLPLRCFGFKFIIQADFITSASRNDILKDRKWNQALLRGVIDAFLLAVERFADHPTLRNVWFRYLPRSIADSFFRDVEHKLMSELKSRKILRSSDGTPALPSQLIIPSKSFRDNAGELLIPEAHLPCGFYYLSPDYDYSLDWFILLLLGPREMTDDDFLEGLQKMDQAGLFGSKSAAWHESVAACILGLRAPVGRRVRPEVTKLSILPLCNGSWALASSAPDFMFPPATMNIPDGLGLKSIAPDIPYSSQRHKLFVLLGVALPDPPTIAKTILSRGDSPSVVDGVAYARFFFEHRRVWKMPRATQLRFVDEHGEGAKGNELYLDLPGEDDALALRDALSPLEARFLHPDYLSAYPEVVAGNVTVGTGVTMDRRSEWINWLQNDACVNALPRVLDGHLTSDFLNRAPELAEKELLLSLRAWWPRLSAHLTRAGVSKLGEVLIAGHQLKKMYLRRGAFALADLGFELPFVPVDDPEDRRWDFLEQFGVAIRLNARFFLDKLKHMQGQGEADIEVVEEIYRQLDARFDEDEELIRDAFAKDPIIFLIKDGSVPVWLSKMDVYWDGSPSLTIRTLIKPTYESLKNFFLKKLRIPNAPPDALVDELRAIAKQHQRRLVPPEVQEHIAKVLADVTEILMKAMPKMPTSFLDLAQIPMFPVSVPSEGVTLRTVDQFYVPDKSGKYANVLRERVALLALQESAIALIRKLLESSIFKDRIRYLEAHVTKRSTPLGMRVLETEATNLYSSRVEYIARLVYHTNKLRNPKEVKPSLPQRAKDFLPKLRKIEVFGVQSITTTLSLGPYNEPMPQDVSFEETDEKFIMFFSRAAGDLSDSLDFAICEELSCLLEIDIMLLSSCISRHISIGYIHKLFKHEGIEEIPVDNDEDRSWLEAMLQANDPVIPEPVASAPAPVRRPMGGLGVPRGSGAWRGYGARDPLVRENASVNGGQRQGQRSPSVQSSAGTSERGPAPAVPTNDGDQTDLPLLPLFVNFPPTSTDDRDLVRVMGENYVYKILCRMLYDFGPNNWTSEVRNCTPGLAPFTASAEAAFTYRDTRGQLTREWFGPGKATAWLGRWPRYHIEVKTTRGEENEPFQMSQVEMTTAFRYSERAEVSTDIYVIMRVSRIGMPEPSYKVYADPHRALFDGQLQHVHDVYLRRKTDPQIGV